jgi:tripartite-type tricarboxylate transporter receptor subunit TctC
LEVAQTQCRVKFAHTKRSFPRPLTGAASLHNRYKHYFRKGNLSMKRRDLLAASAAPVLASFLGTSSAQTAFNFTKPVKFIVPYAPGGLPDTVARVFALRIGERIGQGVVIENKPGGNGAVSAQALANSPNDGHTFLVTDGSMFSINPLIYKSLAYDLKRDFAPVSLLARSPLYLAVHPKVPVNTLQEFVQYVKARPDQLNYGSSGIGSSHHLTMEAIKAALNLDIRHVPFRGSGQSVPALIGGQVECLFSALPSLAGFAKTNQVKILGSNAGQRSSLMPQVPSISEIIPGFDFAVVIGVLASANAPAGAIARLSAEAAAVNKHPELLTTLGTAGIDAVGSSPADYAKAIQSENERLAKAVALAGLKPE